MADERRNDGGERTWYLFPGAEIAHTPYLRNLKLIEMVAGDAQLGFLRTGFVGVAAVDDAAVGFGAAAPHVFFFVDDTDSQAVAGHFPGNIQTDNAGADDAKVVG